MGLDPIQHLVRPAAAEPAGALVMIHGRGADASDLFPVIDILDPDRRLVGLCPKGPLALPPGGAHWYAVHRVGYPDPATFFPTYERLTEWLDGVSGEFGVPLERTIVGGFSQGAVMTYALALGSGRPQPAALMCFSGFIPTVEGFEIDPTGAAGLPIAVGHGIQDPVIGVEFGRAAKEQLTAAGTDLTYRESPMGHSIDPGYLKELIGWVGRVIDAAGATT